MVFQSLDSEVRRVWRSTYMYHFGWRTWIRICSWFSWFPTWNFSIFDASPAPPVLLQRHSCMPGWLKIAACTYKLISLTDPTHFSRLMIANDQCSLLADIVWPTLSGRRCLAGTPSAAVQGAILSSIYWPVFTVGKLERRRWSEG